MSRLKTRFTIAVSLLFLTGTLFVPVLAGDDPNESELIAYVKSYPVNKIEINPDFAGSSPTRPVLPKILFERWLLSVFGETSLEWVANGCNEYNDNGECIFQEVSVKTQAGRCPSVYLKLTVEKTAKNVALGRAVRFIYDGTFNVNDFETNHSLSHLADLEETIREAKAKAAPIRPSSLTLNRLRARKGADIALYVSGLDVRRFDPSLPSERFDKWIGRNTNWLYRWETSKVYTYCGFNRLEVGAFPIVNAAGEYPPISITVKLGLWERELEGEPKLNLGSIERDAETGRSMYAAVENLSTLKNKIDAWKASLLSRKANAKVPVMQDITMIGSFNQVSATPTGHCYGHSLDLWRYGDRTFGLHHLHGGLCGDPPCSALQELKLDPKTGNLEFLSVLSNSEKYKFVGKIERDVVAGNISYVGSGELADEAVELKRDPSRPDGAYNRNIVAWCKFYEPIGRCGGVEKLCASMGIQ